MFETVNNVVKLWSLGDVDVAFSVLYSFMQFVSVSMLWQGVCLNFERVYSSSFHVRMYSLWNDLTNLQGPWCILGEFNVVLSTKESKLHNPSNKVSTNQFGS